ncbi:host-nuclease inhibitor protein Gam [Salmonella enterica]|uniref:Putative host-nuclease inhibitor protein n=1 Tax=Salmonella enterica TaxID=28901 RepID=A0A379QUL5_SALER|nr:host-nuclease inhibitor protein Gam [Salmonella enterica]EBZ4590184.1 host-nuclease inhibitor protein Gam [Salmonella enterica subsp. enterica serovar Hato]ECC9556636.1 host-nuclease inhibitor protein Gam [Salmonella enterica subsp. salamae]ECN6755343.1 host-nuclease inhibitor protein Gam [Salmonella enterica subsp. enterica serovar Newport]EDT8749011.1 host-nuclease inhibitor protein Gam [Salmonella enterica subsp. enterica]
MAKKTSRLKAAAASYMPQSKEQVISDIKEIGDIQRKLTRMETEMNDKIAVITSKYTPDTEALNTKLELLKAGVTAWCGVNRDELTNNGKTKTVKFTTGEVSWRTNPLSVNIKGTKAVLEELIKRKWEQFITRKTDINKAAINDALKADEDAAVGKIKGIIVNKDTETFSITPFEQEFN